MKQLSRSIYFEHYVPQNMGAIIEEGSFSSERHITCYNVLCLNLSLATAFMCHVNERRSQILTEQQSDILKEFLSSQGSKVGLCVLGSQSKMSSALKEHLVAHHVRLLPDMHINTKALTWDVHFRLHDRKLVVTDENETIRYSGRPFPDFESEYAKFLLSQNFFK